MANVPFEVPGPHKNTSTGGDNWSRTGGNEGGWPSITAACNTVTGLALNQRLGTIIAVIESGKPVEYWWPGPGVADSDLVPYMPATVPQTPVQQLRNGPWVAGPWYAGENVFNGTKIIQAKNYIANSTGAPTGNTADWQVIYDAQAPGDYVVTATLNTVIAQWQAYWDGHDVRISALEDAFADVGTPQTGPSGKSAYQIALDNGFVGTQVQWLASLVGPEGKTAYQHALDTGFTGDLTAWLASLVGEEGKSAYQHALDEGFSGTLTQWLASLKGDPGDGAGVMDTFASSVNLNSISIGDDLTGDELRDILKGILTAKAVPLAVTININNPTHERGTSPTVNVSGSVLVNSETGTITNRRILRNGVAWQTFTGNSFSFNDTPTTNTTYLVEVTGSTYGLKTAQASVLFDLVHYYGSAQSRPDAATARALTGKHFLSSGNTGLILNTGTVYKNFYIFTAPGEKVLEVKDLETNAVLTNSFTLVGPVTVNTAAQEPIQGYELRELIQSVPFSSNHRLQITLTNA